MNYLDMYFCVAGFNSLFIKRVIRYSYYIFYKCIRKSHVIYEKQYCKNDVQRFRMIMKKVKVIYDHTIVVSSLKSWNTFKCREFWDLTISQFSNKCMFE